MGLLTIHTDGASRGNPGAAAFAYVIEADGADPIEEAGCLGTMTNNQAEYTALIRALQHALELGAEHDVAVFSDSELMVKQINGEYRVKNDELRDLFEEAKDLCGRFKGRVTVRHVRRARNSRADALCNEALDGKREPMPRAVATPPKPAGPTLPEEAIAVLRSAATAWTAGRKEPTPEDLWATLVGLCKRHGADFSRGR